MTIRTRSRRKSADVSDTPGDTGVVALSTLQPTPTFPNSPPLSPRPSQSKAPRRSKRRKVRSAFRRWKEYSFKHTWVNPAIILLILLTAYFINPRPSNPMHSALFLSYALPRHHSYIPTYAMHDPDQPRFYAKGPLDLAFFAFYMVVLTFTREFLMQRVIRPIAIYNGIKSRAKQNRFMEQAYTALYFAIFGPFGLYVMSRTPVWYFNTDGMYEDFPHKAHDALFKSYYLLQASYWAQQAVVLMLQLEKPRKDFKELVAHHIITLGLIGLSYRFHFTYMGLAVYITHDVSDFFLATSKSLNYVRSPLTTPYFTFFLFVWTYLRHYTNLRILYSVLTSFVTVGPYELNWDTQQYKCWISQYITFGLLAALQLLNLFWMYFIARVAVNVVFKKEEKDPRSEDEEEEEEMIDAAEVEARKRELKQLSGLANGAAAEDPDGHDSYADVVVEGKKSR